MNLKLNSDNLKIATAIIGVDTLWGGNVDDFSGTNRLIADSYFSDYELPPCFFDLTADALRESEGVLGKAVSNEDIIEYARKFSIRECIEFLQSGSSATTDVQKNYQVRMGKALEVMLDLALSQRGIVEEISYARLVEAGTGFAPQLFDVSEHRKIIIDVLEQIGEGPSLHHNNLLAAVDAWRSKRLLASSEMAEVNKVLIPELDVSTQKNILPYLPADFANVSRTNVVFKPIAGANFSGSLNYLGKERSADGSPLYEAVYEINAEIEITKTEFEFLVAHEVVPGHVMTTALTQYLCFTNTSGFGFENTIFPMCSPAATLSEGVANMALFLARGWKSDADITDPDMRLAYLLSVLQDYGKANISYRLHQEKMEPAKVSELTRSECLLTAERAEKLTFAWGAHPLLGKMYMPAYAVGTNIVGDLLKKYGPEKLIPVAYGAQGPVDIISLGHLLHEKYGH